MTDYIFTFDSVFWLSLTTMLLGSFAVALKYCLKSKCDNVECCYGLLKVHRDTKVEEEIELQGTPPLTTDSQSIV